MLNKCSLSLLWCAPMDANRCMHVHSCVGAASYKDLPTEGSSAFSCTTEGWVLVAFPVRKTDCLLHVWENWSANIFCPRLPNSVRKLNCVQWRSYKGQLFFTCMMWHHTPVPHHWSLHWGLQVFPAWYSSQSFDHISVTEITCLKKWLCQYSLSSLWLCCGLRGCGWTP